MNKPSVTMEELWAAQAQFGPFDVEVINGLQWEWDRWWEIRMETMEAERAMKRIPFWTKDEAADFLERWKAEREVPVAQSVGLREDEAGGNSGSTDSVDGDGKGSAAVVRGVE